MRVTLPVLAALLTIAVPSAAQAWALPTTDEGMLAAYLPIARAAWPGSPCSGRETVHLHADAELDAFDALDGTVSDGRGLAATCEVWMRSSAAVPLSAGGFCADLVHELGHLAGYGHTEDPVAVHAPPGRWAAVMSENAWPSWPACVAATTMPPLVWARGAIRGLLPYPRASWTVICTPIHHSGRCRAARLGSVPRRFYVSVAGGGAASIRQL